MYYVYVLLSRKLPKTYVGYTPNLEERLQEHNSGKSYFTNRFKPWVIIHSEEHETKAQALTREKYLKSRSGRRWIKKELFIKLG